MIVDRLTMDNIFWPDRSSSGTETVIILNLFSQSEFENVLKENDFCFSLFLSGTPSTSGIVKIKHCQAQL